MSGWTAMAQDPMVAFPKNYKLALDNDVVQVIRVHYGPHERVGVHDHSRFPTIYVYLSDSGSVRFEHDEQPPFKLTRPPTTIGAFRVSPGRIERHAVTNLGDTGSDFLRVELKQVPLQSGLQPFRGKAPKDPVHNSRAVEYRSPEVDVQRIICEAGTSCKLAASPSPSLLVAFSPIKIIDNDAQQGGLMREGDVKWVRGSNAVSLAPASDPPVHLLSITVKTQAN
jgi:hypothetical protein